MNSKHFIQTTQNMDAQSQLHATKKLYDAALKGDVPSLLNLLGEDPLILDRCIIEKSGKYMQSPLHVAANFGHVNFTKKVIEKKPKLVEVVDHIKRSSPLHIACAEGHLQIVEALLVVNSSICYTHDQDGKTPVHVAAINGKTDVLRALLNVEPQAARERTMGGESVLHLCVKHKQGHLQIVEALLVVNSSICYTHDQDGKTPVHVAAINGQIDVLRALLNVEPQAARERTMGGESVLHLCVKHKQPEALRFLVKTMDDGELLNLDDALGNTVLHLAVAAKQSEMVEIILVHPKIKKNAVNKNGLTVVDTHKQSRKDLIQDKKIWKLLNRANVLPAKEALKTTKDRAWLEDHRTSLMVVASLIATMAFQVGINPPGGVWQDTKTYTSQQDVEELGLHKNHIAYAGTSVWSYGHHFDYNNVLVTNTIGLISSLSVILLLISGLPCKRHLLTVLRIILWISVTATTLTYMFSVSNLTYGDGGIWTALWDSLVAWLGLIGFILVGHCLRFIWKLISWLRRQSIMMCYSIKSKNTTKESNLIDNV